MLYAAIGQLPPPDRDTVGLFRLHQLDLREVAEVQGMVATAVAMVPGRNGLGRDGAGLTCATS